MKTAPTAQMAAKNAGITGDRLGEGFGRSACAPFGRRLGYRRLRFLVQGAGIARSSTPVAFSPLSPISGHKPPHSMLTAGSLTW